MTLPLSLVWVAQEIPRHLDWVNTVKIDEGLLSREEFVALWVKWSALQGFLKLFGSPDQPKGYLIARPVRMGWVFDTEIDYFNTLFLFDPAGEVVWIDTLWAKGFYQEVLTFLRSTNKAYVAWSHGKRLYFKVIREFSEIEAPNKREIEEAFIRLTVPQS